jgi:hypothetical protein
VQYPDNRASLLHCALGCEGLIDTRKYGRYAVIRSNGDEETQPSVPQLNEMFDSCEDEVAQACNPSTPLNTVN